MANTDQPASHTTTTTTATGGNSGIAFIVGVLVVVVAVMGYFLFVGEVGGGDSVTINVEGAGAALEGAAEAVTGN